MATIRKAPGLGEFVHGGFAVPQIPVYPAPVAGILPAAPHVGVNGMGEFVPGQLLLPYNPVTGIPGFANPAQYGMAGLRMRGGGGLGFLPESWGVPAFNFSWDAIKGGTAGWPTYAVLGVGVLVVAGMFFGRGRGRRRRNPGVRRRRNAAGYIDGMGRFRPIRSGIRRTASGAEYPDKQPYTEIRSKGGVVSYGGWGRGGTAKAKAAAKAKTKARPKTTARRRVVRRRTRR